MRSKTIHSSVKRQANVVGKKRTRGGEVGFTVETTYA